MPFPNVTFFNNIFSILKVHNNHTFFVEITEALNLKYLCPSNEVMYLVKCNLKRFSQIFSI